MPKFTVIALVPEWTSPQGTLNVVSVDVDSSGEGWTEDARRAVVRRIEMTGRPEVTYDQDFIALDGGGAMRFHAKIPSNPDVVPVRGANEDD